MSKKRINSCVKGKVGERKAAAFLCSLGFRAERSARNGVKGCHDVIVHDLPNVLLEIKHGVQGLDIGTKAMDDIVTQCRKDVPIMAHKFVATGIRTETATWAILWQPSRKCWRLTYLTPGDGTLVTTTGPASITSVLQRLNAQ